MKLIVSTILLYLSVIAANVATIWAIVEFILYLFKDHLFNWWSLWAFIISTVLSFMFAVLSAMYKNKLNYNNIGS